MSFFGDTCTLINRAPWPINVRWDGKDVTLTTGENQNFPRVAVPYAKNQNVVMGSESANDPSQFRYMVGVKGSKDNCLPMTRDEIEQHQAAPQRLNRQEMREERGDPRAKEVVRGKKAPSNFDAKYSGTHDDGEVFSNAASA